MAADITIVGLGPGPKELRTVAAQTALDTASQILIRDHDGADFSDLLSQPNVTDLKHLRAQAAPHGQRWRASATTVVDAAKQGNVVLAIPGHPRFGEMLTVEVIELAAEHGLTVDVIDGLSMIDLLCTALNIDPVRERVQLMDGRDVSLLTATTPLGGELLRATPSLPMLITHLYSNEILKNLVAQLRRILGADHPVTIVIAAGLPQQSIETSTLSELANHQGNPMMGVYIPPLNDLNATRSPETLQHIVARLRREDGCPWDRKQTNQSLAQSLVDEVYEVIDAINTGDDDNLAEELGDLLLLIMMHAQIAEERGAFILEDVYDAINTKIVRRHPHVFGDLAASNADDVVGLWQEVKAQEKADRPHKPEKAADGQPHSMPALERAARVLRKHPLSETQIPTSDQRSQALLTAISDIVVVGNDPSEVLKSALVDHVQRATHGA